MSHIYKAAVFLACCTLLFAHGCAKPLTPQEEQPIGDAGNTPVGPPKTRVVPGKKVTTKDLGQGVTEVTINATDESSWVYYSFSFNRDVAPEKPDASQEWDLGFQRFKIKSNSGIHGTGNVSVAIVKDQEFGAIEFAPAATYYKDEVDGDDEDKDPDTTFLRDEAWYQYNPQDHTLHPRKRVYILKDVEGQHYKVQLLSFYDDKGNSGFLKFKWAKVRPPKVAPPSGPPVATKDLGDGVTEVTINATEQSAWVYYAFASNGEVKPETPASDKAWALGFQRFQIKTNGGTNGTRGLQVAILDDQDFSALTKAPKEGYIEDKPDGADKDEEPDWAFLHEGTWYAYDPSTHSLSPRKRVYVLKAEENYYKIVMQSFYNDQKQSGFVTFRWAKIDPPS